MLLGLHIQRERPWLMPLRETGITILSWCQRILAAAQDALSP